jgi:hypothetical protein
MEVCEQAGGVMGRGRERWSDRVLFRYRYGRLERFDRLGGLADILAQAVPRLPHSRLQLRRPLPPALVRAARGLDDGLGAGLNLAEQGGGVALAGKAKTIKPTGEVLPNAKGIGSRGEYVKV